MISVFNVDVFAEVMSIGAELANGVVGLVAGCLGLWLVLSDINREQ